MSKTEVVVIDYGVGNLLSVRRGLEYCGATVIVTGDPEVILAAPRVVLPGVGAFSNGMAGLREHDLDATVREVAARGTWLLGICLGMQMLLDDSEEFGSTAGLGLIPGSVIPVPALAADGRPQKIPHIGWSSLVASEPRQSWTGTLLENIKLGDAMYFVHSFMASPINSQHRVADCLYGDIPISAVIGKENVLGCQFHPEKSGEAGLNVLRKFLAL